MAKKNNLNDESDGLVCSLRPDNLKGLAHPLRVKLLGLLREAGAATASQLAQRLGESSGSTSYHLRQLAEYGFIEEDRAKQSRKERWWRAVSFYTHFDEHALLRDSATRLLAGEFMRAVAEANYRRTIEWIDRLPTQSAAWVGAGTASDWALRLTSAELKSLAGELEAIVTRYRRYDPAETALEGSAFVAVQLQLLPDAPYQDPLVALAPGSTPC